MLILKNIHAGLSSRGSLVLGLYLKRGRYKRGWKNLYICLCRNGGIEVWEFIWHLCMAFHSLGNTMLCVIFSQLERTSGPSSFPSSHGITSAVGFSTTFLSVLYLQKHRCSTQEHWELAYVVQKEAQVIFVKVARYVGNGLQESG
ncbi:hypothetical protein sscle_09g073960 [Sclerotinia sclerotiorum 1980 UF-70]|uniref:Uncharacterized protein n=1 Tax=Sclerotinia sclerotiorum (strain ATCC 18683 / 1980 / Ss-1) TaxID=665079 RepID=A0A1D9QCF5_SCLS1|nr:hypothetical protein sscle_09g073960 [Sclerotinia sclerotiorum 1980 UF-70]